MGEKIQEIIWPEKGIQILGIYFSFDVDEAQKGNFDSRYAEMKNTLSKWKRRGLTLIGKIPILKTYII